jgi:hypothetical protein
MSEEHLVVDRRHRRRSRKEAEKLVAEFEASGLNRREFSRLYGIAAGTLDGYRKRHRPSQAGKARGGPLVAVQLQRAASGTVVGSRERILGCAARREQRLGGCAGMRAADRSTAWFRCWRTGAVGARTGASVSRVRIRCGDANLPGDGRNGHAQRV